MLLLFAAVPSGAAAQPARNPPLDAAASELQQIDTAFGGETTADQREVLRDRAARIARHARAETADRVADLSRIDEQAAQLGPIPKGLVEAPDIRARRRALAIDHGKLDSAIKRGNLIAVEADQLSGEIERSDKRAFDAAIFARATSPLLPGYWRPVQRGLPRDLRRLDTFMLAQTKATWGGLQSGRGWVGALGLLTALALIGPVRTLLRRMGQSAMIEHAPGSRLRRSGLALWLTLLGTTVPWLAALILVESFRISGMVSVEWEPLAGAFLRAVVISALIASLGGALLQRHQASWRLLPIADHTAGRLRPWTFAAAVVAVVSVTLSALAGAVGMSAATAGVGDMVAAVVHLVLAFGTLIAIGRIRIETVAATTADTTDDQRLAGVALIVLAPWAAAILAAAALLSGYVAFALVLSRLLLWLPVVLAALYLLLLATDDLCTEIIAGKSAFGGTLHDAFGLRRSLIDQIGVALSAVLRVMLILAGTGIAFAPFGSNLDGLFDQVVQLSHGVTVGEVTIAPGAILRALAVLTGGLFLVRALQRWLTERYLPATELDAGARNSISTVTSYLGLILAALWALGALGIGFQRIALILSALSVGIGFGLQAITQNFVSGLILLIERPVKIGDLVRVGDQEGDVKRISVRATEIEVGDKSTLIVPNSELITKTIRNMTLSNPIGRIKVQFAVPIGSDVAQVRAIVLALFDDANEVLDSPEPRVFIDSLADGNAVFACVAYVRSPRDVYGVRSAILFDLITALRSSGIAIDTPAAAPPSGRTAPNEED